MTIPNADAAFVPAGKLTGYLLAEAHPVGSAKARFFRTHGFAPDQTEILESALLALARTSDAQVRASPHGDEYVATGDLQTPRGSVVRLCTVWIVEPSDPRPRFITAYPA